MPRSTTPKDGRNARNEDRITRLLRIRLGQEIDSLTSEVLRYRRAVKSMDHVAISGQIKYLEDMIRACRRLLTRFTPNAKQHVPQEHRDDDATDS